MIHVLQPGLLTTIQDLGRLGFQKYGVIVSGAMDPFSHRVANLLVGNMEHSPTLEMTLKGPALEFTEDTLIAVTGGGLWPAINGEVLPMWRPILVRGGTVVTFQSNRQGCRAYLAVAGGFLVPYIMGSASTYLRAGLGGFKGRPLQRHDVLRAGVLSPISQERFQRLQQQFNLLSQQRYATTSWFTNFSMIPYHQRTVLHALPGPQFHEFTEESRKWFFQEKFIVGIQSDRMGYRLNGPRLSLSQAEELISEAVTNGTVQVPPDGNPIILTADHQTTGGYPKIAQIVTADLPLLGQIRPGEQIRFELISLAEAQQRLHKQAQDLRQLWLVLNRIQLG